MVSCAKELFRRCGCTKQSGMNFQQFELDGFYVIGMD